MKKRNQLALKFIAVFTIALVISLTINTAFIFSGTNKEITDDSIPTVQAAEQTGCCIETPTGRTCVNDTIATDCLPNKFRTYSGNIKDCSIVAPEDCSPQTCIPKELSEPCLRSKTAAECIGMDGTPITDAMETVPMCTKGCCIINKGDVVGVMQNKTCMYELNKTGYDASKMQFLPDVISQTECIKLGDTSKKVCCVLGGGSCKYGFREECTALNGRAIPLQGGEYCRDVRECAVTTQSKKACGTRTGTEFDIYWFDSQGNQEELVQSCNYQEAFCRINQMTRQPECINTTCSFPLTMTQQNMTKDAPRVTSAPLFSYVLFSGTSQCYNFYTDYGDSGTDGKSGQMYGKSTGLQNEILHCALGKVELQGLGADRNWLCENGYGPDSPDKSSTLHGLETNNSWQNCRGCGIKGGIGPFISGVFAPIPPLGGAISKFGGICTPQNCEKLGDCTFHRKIPGWGFLAAPIGSCDPIYPPGTNSIQSAGGANASCQCGGPADAGGIWNVCSEAECKSQGDCTFKPFNGWQGVGNFILGLVMGTLLSRFTWIPFECTMAAIVTLLIPGPKENIGSCFITAYKEYGKYPYNAVKWFIDADSKTKIAIGIVGGILAIFGLSNIIPKVG